MGTGQKILWATITALFTTIIAAFFVSHTLARFVSVQIAEGTVNAPRFNLNCTLNVETGQMEYSDWELINLGVTTDENANENGELIYPGQSGAFELNVDFISDVLTAVDISDVEVSGTGAFSLQTPAYVFEGQEDVLAIDNTALKFVITTTSYESMNMVPWSNAVNFSGLKTAIQNGFYNLFDGNIPVYTDKGTKISGSVYVYWKWEFSDNSNADSIDSYLSVYAYSMMSDLDVESTIYVGVGLKTEQIEPHALVYNANLQQYQYISGNTGNPATDWSNSTEIVNDETYYTYDDSSLGAKIYYNNGEYYIMSESVLVNYSKNYSFIYSTGYYGQKQ